MVNIFSDYVIQCGDKVKIFALLPTLGLYDSYQWVISNHFGKEYSGTLAIDDDGFPYIDTQDPALPEGFFNQYAGTYELTIINGACGQVEIFLASNYDKICFEVRPGNRIKNNLGCPFNKPSSVVINKSIISFTNTDFVTVEWTPQLRALYGDSPTLQVYHEVDTNIYQLANVTTQTHFDNGVLTSVVIFNAGPATGYILIQ